MSYGLTGMRGPRAAFEEMSCADFQALGVWPAIKRDATQNAAAKSQTIRDAVARLIADIEAWNTNSGCRYIHYDFAGHQGVAVVMPDGPEVNGYCTVRYILSDGSQRCIGQKLIEAAAMISPGGKLSLIADNDFLESHYRKYGFVTIQAAGMFNGAIMTLNPDRPLWMRSRDGWCFTGHPII